MTRPTRPAHRTLLALLFTASAAAHAGRPLATEDADVLERGRCEWESFAARTHASGSDATRDWATQVGCGIGLRSQVALAHARSTAAGDTTRGWLLGGKTALLPREDGATGFTLAWGLSVEKAAGTSWQRESSLLNLVATRELAAGYTVHANLGWLHSHSAAASSTNWNLALERAFDGGIDLMAELYGDDRTRAWLGFGARWAASERLSLNASWAVQDDASRARLWTLGFKLAF